MLAFLRKNSFLIALLLLFIAVDQAVAIWDPVDKYDVFTKNDVQRTVHHHPEKPWNKVFYGNSSVNAAYDDKASPSGFINYGISYGRMTDLNSILRTGRLPDVKELAIGLNIYTFMDKFPTDPSYPWYQQFYEPYLYFHRDAISEAVRKYALPFLRGKPIAINRDQMYRKQEYYGTLPIAVLQLKLAEFNEKYGERTLQDFAKNLLALQQVIQYSQQHNIQLKLIWMPWNPTFPPPGYAEELKDEVRGILSRWNIPLTDWTDRFAASDFHDLGHLNVEHGRPLFTEEIAHWLNESLSNP